MTDRIVLASASPRRSELLKQIGLDFNVIPSDVDEQPLAEESPQQLVVRLSLAKASDVADRKEVDGRWFIGSDTIVLCAGMILGKPEDDNHARQMLEQLSGREHQVLSGYAVIDRRTGRRKMEAVSTQVRFRDLTDEEITSYIATSEPADKAGAYAIQGLGVCFVAEIRGSYTNVVGMPLCRLTLALKELDVPMII